MLDAKVDLASGNFSLVVDGENARIAPEAYRKLITALWCVYYSEQDPGISIDPIDPDKKKHEEGGKHLVRYIGRVVNTDLGRVMRQADYLMKKWGVGTEEPGVPQVRDIEGYWRKHGLTKLGLADDSGSCPKIAVQGRWRPAANVRFVDAIVEIE